MNKYLIKKYLKEEKDPEIMTSGQINKELDKLDKKSSEFIDQLIKVGRGTEKHSDIIKKTDPLSIKYKKVLERQRKLRMEIEFRYGPGAPSRLPKGFKPRKKL